MNQTELAHRIVELVKPIAPRAMARFCPALDQAEVFIPQTGRITVNVDGSIRPDCIGREHALEKMQRVAAVLRAAGLNVPVRTIRGELIGLRPHVGVTYTL